MSELYAVPIVCLTGGCAGRGRLVNVVSGLLEEDLDSFYEGYDESCPEDYCPICGELGVADDPVDEETLTHIHGRVD